MLERLTHPMLVCEWDQETGQAWLVVGLPGPRAGARELEWGLMKEVWDSLLDREIGWTDLEVRERHATDARAGCVPWGDEVAIAVAWRLRFDEPSQSVVLSEIVKAGLQVTDGHTRDLR